MPRTAWVASLLVALLIAPLASTAPVDVPTPGPCEGAGPVPPCNHWASRPPTGPANEVHVAVDPNDPDHVLVAAKDYGFGADTVCNSSGRYHVASASYVTFDGGESWSVSRVPAQYPADPSPASPLPYKCGSDPVVAFGPDGTAYYIVLTFDYDGGRKAGIGVARSLDGGVTWPADEIQLLHTSSGDDKQWGTVDRHGRVHVVWTDLATGEILYTRSQRGFTFEATETLGHAGQGNPAVTVATGPTGQVHVLWRDGRELVHRLSRDHGASFDPAHVALTVQPFDSARSEPRLPFMPQIAVDDHPGSPYEGRLYVVWPDTRAGDAGVFMASSGDDGGTWTTPVQVDDNLLPNKAQVMPQVSVAPTGRVDVVWLDERDDPRAEETTWRAYASASADAGATWAANRPVSQVPLVETWSHHQSGAIFIGDYIGAASTSTHLLGAFPGNGPDRVLEGLDPQEVDRVDATLAPVAFLDLVPGLVAPPAASSTASPADASPPAPGPRMELVLD